MIRHVFFWSVEDDADAEFVFDQIASLEHSVPGPRTFSIGRQIKTGQHASIGVWQYALVSDFDSQEALDAYDAHPAHQDVLERVFSKYKDWAVVDYIV